MAKKNVVGRKPSGAEGIAVIDEPADSSNGAEPVATATPATALNPIKPKEKSKVDESSSGNVGIGEIRKAATFANSVGGLDKAMALLQILKVAKEVQ